MTGPAPPIDESIDVRDMDGFMLNAERLLASELWALSTGEEFKAAMGLWCRSWKQIPAASLPNDERVLASFAGVTMVRWKKIRNMALRGFVECSDGRLYHADLAFVAQTACRQRERLAKLHDTTWARMRIAVFRRDGFACRYCGATADLQCDHVLAASRGGEDTFENLAAACGYCNRSKGNRPLSLWTEKRGW